MEKTWVGIDVSKRKLDLTLYPQRYYEEYSNDVTGFKEIFKALGGYEVELIVFESTGGYEIPASYFLVEQGFPVSIINPNRIKSYAKAKNQKCKTDKMDSSLISEFAFQIQPERINLISLEARELKELVLRRKQLLDNISMEESRLETIVSKVLVKDLKQHIEQLSKRLKKIEQLISKKIESNPEWNEKKELLKQVSGIGEVASNFLIAELPELGTLSSSEISGLLGVAPVNRDSGSKSGKRFIQGGRANVRKTLYMATLVATRFNPKIKEFYLRLREKGKPAKLVLTACMRKFIVILNAIVKNFYRGLPIHT